MSAFLSDAMRAAAVDLDNDVATALEVLANHVSGDSEQAVPELNDPLNAFERIIARTGARDEGTVAHFTRRLALYRALVTTIKQLSLKIPERRARQTPQSLLEPGDVSLEGGKLKPIRSSFCSGGPTIFAMTVRSPSARAKLAARRSVRSAISRGINALRTTKR